MALAINDFGTEGSGRDRLSRALGVASALYGLLAVITAGVAVAGLFGLAGLPVDPAAIEPARLLAMPWGLAAGGGDATASLLVVLGGLAVNLLTLVVGSRLARGRLRA